MKSVATSPAAVRRTPLPIKQLAAILLAQLNEQILVGLPYLIAVYMVRDWLREDASEEEVGRMSGLLWLIVMSNVTSMLSVAAFGMATSYWTAFAARCLGGFFNCTFLSVKAMLGDITDLTNQDIAMSYLGISVGLGSLLAPVIGGTLARPCMEYGDSFIFCGPGGFLNDRPYFLPCLAVAAISLVASLSSLFLLEETLPRLSHVRPGYLRMRTSSGEAAAVEECKHALEPCEAMIASHPECVQHATADNGTQEEDALELQPLSCPIDLSPKAIALANDHAWSAGLACAQDPEMAVKLVCRQEPDSRAQWFTSRQVLLTLGGYGLAAFAYNVMDELVPLYASAQPRLGGLGLASNQLAIPIMASGPIMIAWSVWGFPPLQRILKGPLPTLRLAILLAAPLTMLIPLSSLTASNVGASLSILTASFCLIRPVAASVYTCSMLLINSSGPPSQLGTINGFAQAAASASKALGPFAGGLIWGATLHLPFPGHQFLVFGLTSCILLLVELVYGAVRS